MQTEELFESNIAAAEVFENLLRDDAFFTHFKHTTARQQLESLNWNVFLWLGDDKRVIGWEQIQNFPEHEKRHIARLGYAILPEYRGKGLGRKMVLHSIEYCKEGGFSKLEATSRLDNIPMVVNFIKADFHIEGCFVGAVGNKHVVSWARFV